jgi:hypothetical protein
MFAFAVFAAGRRYANKFLHAGAGGHFALELQSAEIPTHFGLTFSGLTTSACSSSPPALGWHVTMKYLALKYLALKYLALKYLAFHFPAPGSCHVASQIHARRFR